MRYPVFDPMMPDDYRPNPANPLDPAFEGDYCQNCDQIEYVGTLKHNEGICGDCQYAEDDE